MDHAVKQQDTPRPLSALLEEGQPWPLDHSLRLVHRLGMQVQALHESGRTHLAINVDTVMVDDQLRPHLTAGVSHRHFGGEDSDPQFCPPELAEGDGLEIPESIEAAARLLAARRHTLDPRRIDIYQLGTLLCRLLSGEPIQAYMYRPKVKAAVPVVMRSLLEGALGYGADNRFETCGRLLEALDESLRDLGDAPISSSTRATPPRGSALGREGNTPAPGNPTPRSSNEAADSSEELPFQRLGRYRILGRIGSGGMGDVYRGYDESLDRAVAVKVLPPELAKQADFVERFRAEATAAARIAHPNVVPIYSIDEDAGHHFFTMQYVEGESLAARLDRLKRLASQEAVQIIAECLAGLEAAHKAGLIHRDIKPANILLDSATGRAMLVDFGLVRKMDQDQRLTATGVVMGTLDYISPEQVRGKRVDGRADLYSLGVVFYRMLAGRLPFMADTPTAMLFQHVYAKPFPLRTAEPGLSEPLVRIIERLLAKDPDLRYRDCAAVLAELRALGEERPEPNESPAGGTPVGAFSSPMAPARDALWNRMQDWAATMFRRHAPQALKELQSTTLQVDGAVSQSDRRRDRLAKLLAESESILADLEEQIQAYREMGNAAAREAESASSVDVAQAALIRKQQAEEQAAALEPARREQEHEREDLRLELDKAEAEAATLRAQRDLMNARLQAARARLAIQQGPPRSRRRWKQVAAGAVAASALIVALLAVYALRHRPSQEASSSAVSAATPEPEVERDPAPITVPQPTPAPQKSAVSQTADVPRVPPSPAVEPPRKRARPSRRSAADDGVGVAKSDREMMRFSKMGWNVTSLAFSPSGSLLAAGKMDRALMVFDLEKQARASFLDHLEGLGQVTCVAFTPDSRKLLAGGDRGRIQVWDAAPNGVLTESSRFVGHAGTVHTIVLSADGRHALSSADDKQLRYWDLASGSERFAIGEFHNNVKAVCFIKNGQEALASDGRTLFRIDVKQGIAVQEHSLTSSSAHAVAISPDGSRIAVSELYAIRVWDCRTGQEAPRLQDREIQWTAVFSPNGKYILSGARGKVNVWQLATQRRIAELDTAGSGYVQCLAISSDGEFVAAIPSSAGQDLQVFVLPPEVAAK